VPISKRGRAVLDELRVKQGLDPLLPWGGRSPRCLTAAYKRFNFESRDDDVNGFLSDRELEEQYQRFLYGT